MEAFAHTKHRLVLDFDHFGERGGVREAWEQGAVRFCQKYQQGMTQFAPSDGDEVYLQRR